MKKPLANQITVSQIKDFLISRYSVKTDSKTFAESLFVREFQECFSTTEIENINADSLLAQIQSLNSGWEQRFVLKTFSPLEKQDFVIDEEEGNSYLVNKDFLIKGSFVVGYLHAQLKQVMVLYFFNQFSSAVNEKKEEIKNGNRCSLVFVKQDTDKTSIFEIPLEIRKHLLQNVKTVINKKVSFLCYNEGFYLEQVPAPKNKYDIDLNINYGEGFSKVNSNIQDFMNSSNTGLILFHGEPGTGKTSYVRYLLSNLNKNIVYIPPNLLSKLASPEFLDFILKNKDLILLIEDAEEIIMSREESGNSTGVSSLLNLTDGILGDCLKIKIIATFNMKLENIDKALLRKGRLVIRHKFSKLSVKDSNTLLKKIGKNIITTEPMTLGEIYNFGGQDFFIDENVRKIGFAS